MLLNLAHRVIGQREDLLAGVQYAQVTRSVGLLIEAEGLHAALGSICWLMRSRDQIPCEVVGFTDEKSFLMPGRRERRGPVPGQAR